MEQKAEKILFEIGILFLAVLSVGFLGIPTKYILLTLVILCAGQMILNKKSYLDISALLLLAGMFVYSIGIGEETTDLIKTALIPFFFYICGKSVLATQEKDVCEYRTKAVIVVLSLGLLIATVLNAISYYRYGLEGGRAWREFWTGNRLPATQHVFYSLFIVSLLFYGIYYCKKNWMLNGILVLGGLWCAWFSVITGSRTLLLVLGLVFVANIVLYYYFNWKDEAKQRYLKLSLKGILIICAVVVAVYLLNVGGIADTLKNSMWGRGGGIFHNIRFQAQLTILKQLPAHPFGGREIEAELYYAHNVWIDMANSGGVIPFALIVVYTILTIFDLIRLIRRQDISQEIKYLLVSAYASLFLYYMVEPALDAHLMFWAIWMLVCGLVRGNLDNSDFVKNEKEI